MNIIRNIIYVSSYFFLAYLIVYSTYILICAVAGSFSMFRYKRMDNLHNVLEHDFYYPMSIIVPAYNESVSIVQTINSLLNLDYKLYEIVVVDDGSIDNTKQLVVDAFHMRLEENRPIRYELSCKPIREIYTAKIDDITIILISKENGGCKADAVNAGINISNYPYIVNMDGDEILQKDALKMVSRAILEDDNVLGVGGNIKMSNYVEFQNSMPVKTDIGKNLIVDMQVIEYGRAFVGTRIFQNESNMNLIISGGFGVFRKSAVIEVGGFDPKSMGEDMDITVRLHEYYRKNKKPYSMKYVPNSVCWTQGPATLSDLKKQRQRWYCGLVQTIAKYRHMIFNPRYGIVGMFMFPYVIWYELLNPFIMLLGWFVIGWTFFDQSINFPYVAYIYIIYFVFGILISLVPFWDKIYMDNDSISPKKMMIALYVAIVDCLFFRIYLSFISFLALFKMKTLRKKWESPKRVVVKSE